jgi:O-antigen ligase
MINRLRQRVANEQIWFFVIVAISMTPLVQGLLTTTLDGYVTYPQSVIRVLSVVTILADLFVVIVGIKLGFLQYIRSSISTSAKILFAVLFASAMLPVFTDNSLVMFSLLITLRFFLQVTVLFCLIHILSSSSKFDVVRYFSVMMAGVFLYIAYIILIIAMIPNHASFYWLGGLPSATNVRHIGNYVAIMLFAAIGLFLFIKNPNQWRILGATFVATMFLAWTGSRAAFVGLIVALPTAIYVVRHKVSATRIGILAATLIVAVLATVPLPTPDPSYGVMRMINASDVRQSSDISSSRTIVWQHTIEDIAQAPLAGHGAGRFLSNMDAKYRYDLDNPHNFVLQFGYDWGILGLAIVLLLLVFGSVKLFKLPIISPLATFCAVSGLMLMLSIGMLEGMFYHPLKMLLASALIAPAFASARREQTASTGRTRSEESVPYEAFC